MKKEYESGKFCDDGEGGMGQLMNISVAVSQNWGIGYKNELLFRIREDLAIFRKRTAGNVVVMGHNTYKSLGMVGGLKNRVNVVLSRGSGLVIPGVVTCDDLDKLPQLLSAYTGKEIYVIGGDAIYRQLLSSCRKAYVTKVDREPEADTFFSNIDEMEGWQIIEKSERKEQGDLGYTFYTYENKSYVEFCEKQK